MDKTNASMMIIVKEDNDHYKLIYGKRCVSDKLKHTIMSLRIMGFYYGTIERMFQRLIDMEHNYAEIDIETGMVIKTMEIPL